MGGRRKEQFHRTGIRGARLWLEQASSNSDCNKAKAADKVWEKSEKKSRETEDVKGSRCRVKKSARRIIGGCFHRGEKEI